MSRAEQELLMALAAMRDMEPPALDDELTEDMITLAVEAMVEDEWLTDGDLPEPSIERPKPVASPVRWLAFALPLAAAAALTLMGIALTQQAEQPLEVAAIEVVDANPTVEWLVFDAVEGLDVVVTENQPVVLRMSDHREVLLHGTGVLQVESVDNPRIRIRRGVLHATWRSADKGILRFTSRFGAVDLIRGVAAVQVSDTAFSWELEQGEAREVKAAPPVRSRPKLAPTQIVEPEPARDVAPVPTIDPTPPNPTQEGIDTEEEAEVAAPSAGQLFDEAEAAMRDGRRAQAIEMLIELRRLHPNSATAELALMDLARLMGERDPDAGATMYRKYLRDYPEGALREEADRALRGPEKKRRR